MKVSHYKYVILAIVLLLLSVAGGCMQDTDGAGQDQNGQSQNENIQNEPNPKEQTESEQDLYAREEIITLDWYINFSWYNTVWGDNMVSEAITERTGVDINFIVPMGNEAEKFNSLIASDALPDLITLGWWETQVDVMTGNDMVYALNELADEYEPYFWEVADDAVIDWYTQEDGNIYCYPNSFYKPSDYEENDNIGSQQTFLVRKDIYEAIGSPDMTTPEGFAAAVKAAAAAYPLTDGKPLIPIGAHEFNETGCVSFDTQLQNFLAVPYEKDGVYYDRFSDPEYIRWLKVFRQLGEEGYLKEDIFIDQRTQMQEKLAEGRYFCMFYQRTDMEEQQKILYARNPEQIYIAVNGPKNSRGSDHLLPGAGINGWTVTLISRNCRDPERAIRFLSYLMSDEGQKMTYLGIEGQMYDMVDGQPIIKEEVSRLMNTDQIAYNRLYGGNNAYWMLQDNVMQLQWLPPLEPPTGQLLEWTYPYTTYLGQYEINFDSNSPEGVANWQIQLLWSTVLPQLLLAPTEDEFNRIFDDFLKERHSLGHEEVMAESTRQMQAAKVKLGMK